MDERFKRGGVARVLFLRSNPEIDFHAGWIGFTTGQRPLRRIAGLVGLGIAGPFHHHEMGIVVLIEHLIVLVHRSRDPPSEIEPGFGVQRIAVARVIMFVNFGCDASILKRGFAANRSKTVRYRSAPSTNSATTWSLFVSSFTFNVDGALHRCHVLPGVIEVIPGNLIVHASDQNRFLAL